MICSPILVAHLVFPLLLSQSSETQRPYAKRAVVSVSRPASEVGIRILREGETRWMPPSPPPSRWQ